MIKHPNNFLVPKSCMQGSLNTSTPLIELLSCNTFFHFSTVYSLQLVNQCTYNTLTCFFHSVADHVDKIPLSKSALKSIQDSFQKNNANILFDNQENKTTQVSISLSARYEISSNLSQYFKDTCSYDIF